MAVDIKNLVAAINPELYCDNSYGSDGKRISDSVKKIAKEEGYLKAAEKAKLRESDYIDVPHLKLTKGAFECAGLKAPIEQHKMVYDVYSQSLEQIYFWILDEINKEFDGGADKLVDNFVSSPGGGHFSEFQKKATLMQEEGMKIFGVVNQIIRGILNIIYDLKEFQINLVTYGDLKSDDEKVKNAALLSLKQRWLDNVDIKKQRSAIYMLAQNFDYALLIDAFMAVKTLDDVKNMDLNDRVKRILEQRIAEFNKWVVESEKELKKRFEIEKLYLRSQVNSVRLYTRWAKPYLRAARQLEQNLKPTADIVNIFDTAMFELVLMAKGKYDPLKDVASGELPEVFKKLKLRKYTPATIVELRFRSVPSRETQQGAYGYRGKVEVTFTSFALNVDEMKVLAEKIEEDDLGDAFKFIEGVTDESLGQIKDDINALLGEEVKEEKKEKKAEDTNPFSALWSFFKSDKKDEKKDLSKGILKDSNYEKIVRSQAILEARWACRRLYDSFKKAHGMPAFSPVIE